MKALLFCFDFYIKSSLHVALALFCFVQITYLSLNVPSNYCYSFCIFFGTITAYNFLKYAEICINKSNRSTNYIGIIIVSFSSFLGCLFYFFQLSTAFQIQLFCVGLLVLIYPFIRKIALLKISFVALCVTIIAVKIPFINMKEVPFDYYLFEVQIFIFALISIIPFEIVDSKTDAVALNTIVQKYGIRASKSSGFLLFIPFLAIEFLKMQPSFIVFFVAFISMLFLAFSSAEKSKYYSSFWVEAIPILWWVLLLIFNK